MKHGPQTSLPRISFLVAGTALCWAATCQMSSQGTSNRVPAQATFRDSSTLPDRILSDGLGTYYDAVGCVVAWVDSKSGFFFLRTVGPKCQNPVRSLVLDFSDAVSRSAGCNVPDPNDTSGKSLDICGKNTLPDVRVLADTLFRDTALTKGTTVKLPFSLQPDFGGTDFELDFEQPLSVTATSGNERVLEAGTDAVAELYQLTQRGPKISLGRIIHDSEDTKSLLCYKHVV